jgi:hypothetical protein
MTSEELTSLIKKNPVGVCCAFISLVLAAGIYLRFGEVPAAEAELAQKTKEADRYSANIKNGAQLKEQYEALAAATKEVDSRLVRANQLGLNNQFFFKLESETGSKLIDFRQNGLVAPKGAKTIYSPVGFSVAVQGEMVSLMRFLRQLESGAHYSRIMSATCMPGGKEPRRGSLTLTLSVELLGLP